jgi:hypothetical protein
MIGGTGVSESDAMGLAVRAVLTVAQIGVGLLLGILGWSLRQNLAAMKNEYAGLREQLGALATEVRAVASAVGRQERDLAAHVARTDARVDGLKERVDRLEDRDRGSPAGG